MKLFSNDDIETFQLCATLLFYESKNGGKQKYIITIPGYDHNLKMKFPLNMLPYKQFENNKTSVPALICQIKNMTDPNPFLNFEIYIIPHAERQKLSVVYFYTENSKYYKAENFILPTASDKEYNSASSGRKKILTIVS